MTRHATKAGTALLTVLALAACAGEDAPDATPAAEAPETEAPTHVGDAEATAMDETGTDLLDPTTASREELLALDGIDEALADALVAGRPYADMTEVDAVLAGSLDEAGREDVYRELWMPLDLNTASQEEILLIPGVGERMLHEFEEYRPYRAIEEFRREIGKYVDEDEVARLEQYVTIR